MPLIEHSILPPKTHKSTEFS